MGHFTTFYIYKYGGLLKGGDPKIIHNVFSIINHPAIGGPFQDSHIYQVYFPQCSVVNVSRSTSRSNVCDSLATGVRRNPSLLGRNIPWHLESPGGGKEVLWTLRKCEFNKGFIHEPWVV